MENAINLWPGGLWSGSAVCRSRSADLGPDQAKCMMEQDKSDISWSFWG